MYEDYKKTVFDRRDGLRVRKVDKVYAVLPIVVKDRIASQNYYEEDILLDPIEDFIKRNRDSLGDFSILHIYIAALVRLLSQRPRLNRFIYSNKIYARKEVSIALVIKRALSDNGEETIIKTVFSPEDTLQDVIRKFQENMDKYSHIGQQSITDSVGTKLQKLPVWVSRAAINLFLLLDRWGMLPKSIIDASPWHCSVLVTNLGSIGIPPIYHHLYNFGNCSQFLAMGNKRKQNVLDDDGSVQSNRFMTIRCTTDERVCDGFYYSSSMRMLRRLLRNPELLLLPPTGIVLDDGVTNKQK